MSYNLRKNKHKEKENNASSNLEIPKQTYKKNNDSKNTKKLSFDN